MMAMQTSKGLFGVDPSDPHFAEFREMVANAVMSRSNFIQKFFDPRRDLNKECGYPETGSVNAREYKEMYDRESIATRVCEVMAKESWQVQPQVFENPDPKTTTTFETAWDEISKTLRGTSWYKTEQGNPIWEYLMRADIQSGIGHYGVLLIGIDDGKPLDQPVEGIDEKTGKAAGSATPKRKLLFLRSFDESQAQITVCETDKASPRYGQPTKYLLTFHDPQVNVNGVVGTDTTAQEVHWTRIVHLADNLNSSEFIGVPRQRPVWNRLLDLRKLYGGSAEMYWRGAFPGLSIETHPQLGGDVNIDQVAVRQGVNDYYNGLQRALFTMGMTAKSLAPQVVDPTPQIEAQLTAICIELGIPKRVFMGSERGELASSQDDDAWNDRLRFRQDNYITPRIIVPFIDRLIAMQVLPVPTEYYVTWTDLSSLSDNDRADIAVKRTQAMAAFIQGGCEALMTPTDFYTRLLNFSDEDAKAIIQAVIDQGEGEETGESPLLKMVGGIQAMAALLQLAGEKKLSEDQVKEVVKLFFKLDDEGADALIADGFPEPPAPVLPTGAKPPVGGKPTAAKPVTQPKGATK
jgi:hypothetical protein